MTLLDWAQIFFLSVVVIVSLVGMIKVIFFDKNKK
jgi:hypothetical protein